MAKVIRKVEKEYRIEYLKIGSNKWTRLLESFDTFKEAWSYVTEDMGHVRHDLRIVEVETVVSESYTKFLR